MEYHLALDGTDSPVGGCTTWTGVKIIDKLFAHDPNISFIGFPKLIRLNPNIPIKTRGNGAIALHFKTTLDLSQVITYSRQIFDDDVFRYRRDLEPKAGIIISTRLDNSDQFYKQSLQYYLDYEETHLPEFIDYKWPESSPSHIGAWASLNADLSQDSTFELIAYRKEHQFGNPRIIHYQQLEQLALKYPSTFSSIDAQQERELICPAGPDPVFCGIRGDDPNDLKLFFKELELKEDLASYCIFQTNQATDVHISLPKTTLDPYSVFSGYLTINRKPEELTGGHLKISVRNRDRITNVMVFEPTKQLCDQARNLIPGDIIYLHGGIMSDEHGISIHAEYFSVIHLEKMITEIAPLCSCNNRMTKAGSFSGYKCNDCGNQSFYPQITIEPRKLHIGQRFYASASAQRHLTRPKERVLCRQGDDREMLSPAEFRKILIES